MEDKVYYPDKLNEYVNKKPIEAEGGELIFKKIGNKYRLKHDLKGKPSHEDGGVDVLAEEGDVIVPKKDANKIRNMVGKGGYVKDNFAFNSYRMNLPKDANKAKFGLDNTDSFLPKVNAPNFDITGMDFSTNIPTEGYTTRGGVGDYNEPINNGGNSSNMTTSTNNLNKIGGALNTGLELAPIAYNTIRGLSKPQQVQRNYYNPSKYQYTDISSPARREALESYNVDKANINNVRGGRGQQQAYLQQASNNRYKRLQDISNFEGGRKMDVYNRNTELDNQAKLGNLELNNQYNVIDSQNRARRNGFLASAAGQVSDFAQRNKLENNMKNMDQYRLGLYNQMFPNYHIDENNQVKYKIGNNRFK